MVTQECIPRQAQRYYESKGFFRDSLRTVEIKKSYVHAECSLPQKYPGVKCVEEAFNVHAQPLQGHDIALQHKKWRDYYIR